MRVVPFLALLALLAGWPLLAQEAAPPTLTATAHLVPFATAPEGEGYFAIVEGHNGRLYIGTHANAVNSWLVEFDPVTDTMKAVVDAMAAIGYQATGFVAQAKIHTRNNVGASGRIYFATKQGYPAKDEQRLEYPGGYPMTYDPATGTTKVYPIPVPHHGIISITPDEARGVAYISTCSDTRPIESTHFLVLDLERETYKDLIDARHVYAFIVVDWQGRAYHPLLGGEIARYHPETDELVRLKQTIDGQPPTAESHLADPQSHPINWDISADRKTLYAVPMSSNALYAYDLTAEGETLPGRLLGPLLPGAEKTDCRALCIGPTGTVWAAVTMPGKGGRRPHLVRYRPGQDSAPVDLGLLTVGNLDLDSFKDETGKVKPYHAGFVRLENGDVINKNVLLGVCEGRNGDVYVLALHPYSVLRVAQAGLPD